MPLDDRPNHGNVIAPFDARGEIDTRALRENLWYVANGENKVFVGGPAAAEFHHLTRREKSFLWEFCVRELSGKAPVCMIPVGPASTAEMIEMYREGQALGYDGALLYVPGPVRGGYPWYEREVERYYRDVLEAVSLPLYLCAYHGGDIIDTQDHRVSPALLGRLTEEYGERIVGVATTFNLQETLAAVGGRVPVRAVDVPGRYSLLAQGFYGFHSAAETIAPKLCASIPDLYHAGDKEGARRMSAVLDGLWKLVGPGQRYAYPRCVKPLLRHLGFAVGEIRRPFLALPPDEERALLREFDALGVREVEGR